MTDVYMSKRDLNDAGEAFEVLVLEPVEPRAVVLFAVGAGGDPERHRPFLQSMAAQGCAVAAPRFERMLSVAPNVDELAMRARRLRLALDEVTQPNLPAAGVGHSIGAAVLLMMAGGEASTSTGGIVRVPLESRLKKLALMAPATAFFRAPGALKGANASVVVWTGTNDQVTPPATAQFLEATLQGIVPVEVRTVADAGHFSFMNAPPPQVPETLADRAMFLESLATEMIRFIR